MRRQRVAGLAARCFCYISATVPSLPIDPLLDEIVRTLARDRAVVIEAPPGAGKTTRVPPALLDAGVLGSGEVLVSEPRRLAARLAARHVAAERGETLGESVGYSVRFEDVSSARTRVRFVTEGVLVRRLLADPELRGVSAVILDEAHERNLATDLSLALLARLRKTSRPDLMLAAMSATLDGEPVARFLGDCPRIRSQGRSFEVTIEHASAPDDRPLELQVVSAVRALVSGGDVLVFLPGAGEIRRAQSALSALAEKERLLVLPLHGNASVDEQNRAVEPAERRKVILSTNVAESSVTIDGVTAVVDSGLARVATHSPWSGLSKLSVQKVSRASAIQRAGRAGRTAPGRVIRLYTRGDFQARPEQDKPEIERADLSELELVLHGSGVGDAGAVEWLTPPPAAALGAARTLLSDLGAVTDAKVTDVGRRMLDFPLHPRLSRLLVEGEARGVAKRAALVAALLSERDIRSGARTSFGGGQALDGARGPSDVLELVDRFEEAAEARFSRSVIGAARLDAGAVRAVERARKQLARLVRERGPELHGSEEEDDALRLCILSAFVDRVAKRLGPGRRDLALSGGGTAKLSEASVVHDAELMVAVDVEGGALRGGAVVRLASAVEPEWLLDSERLQELDTVEWNASAERAERVTRLSYGAVVLEETRAVAPPSDAASALVLRAALARGTGQYAARAGLDGFLARLALLGEALPEAAFPELGPKPIEHALEAASAGVVSLAELDAGDPTLALFHELSPDQQRLLREQAPEHVTLFGGRSVEVHYEAGKPPWIASRLQDFFGMADGPRVAKGRVPVTLHLLAPNRRAVQVTSDLAGFWERHYPALRRELGRRSPKHSWPEDGRSAKPPAPGRLR